ncbi:MAG TPA: hypothetical protein VGD69_24860 [Herpetosiphonaceae bacterium]
MSNVQILIDNLDVSKVQVQTDEKVIQTLYRGNNLWFAVPLNSDVRIEYLSSSMYMTITVESASAGEPVAVSETPVTLELFENVPLYIKATSSMRLNAQLVASSSQVGDKEANTEDSPAPFQAVKCGEVIIFPPA